MQKPLFINLGLISPHDTFQSGCVRLRISCSKPNGKQGAEMRLGFQSSQFPCLSHGVLSYKDEVWEQQCSTKEPWWWSPGAVCSFWCYSGCFLLSNLVSRYLKCLRANTTQTPLPLGELWNSFTISQASCKQKLSSRKTSKSFSLLSCSKCS